jgi:hypothetical protein
MSHFCIYQAQYLIVFSDTLSYPPYFNDAGSPGAEGAWVRGSLSGACWEHAHAEPGGLLGAARGTWEPAGSLLGVRMLPSLGALPSLCWCGSNIHLTLLWPSWDDF